MDQGIVFVVVRAELDYRSPARYGDTFLIETVVSDLSAASMTFAHVVKEKRSGRVIVEGSARLASSDGHGKVKRLDKTVVAILQSGADKESLNG